MVFSDLFPRGWWSERVGDCPDRDLPDTGTALLLLPLLLPLSLLEEALEELLRRGERYTL